MEEQKLQLKVQALLQRVGNLVTRHENELADLRVEYTIEISKKEVEIEELKETLNELKRSQEVAIAEPEGIPGSDDTD